MAETKKYLYGPVPSRRLGLSLGVDIIPAKVCTLDCIYCQLGRTTDKTVERKDYVPVEDVLAELETAAAGGIRADFVTVGGSGEPTLHQGLGRLIQGIKQITSVPAAVLTNGTLFYSADVRADCAKADLVMPSLDAADDETFQRMNRPHRDISIEKLISGLCEFRKEYDGKIWLEVFFVDGVNTGAEQIAGLADAIKLIRPNKVHLNTAVRPTAEPWVNRLETERLKTIAGQLGPNCEVIADFPVGTHRPQTTDRGDRSTLEGTPDIAESVLLVLKRRPCSLKDISASLDIHPNEALKYIGRLQQEGLIDSEQRQGTLFFRAR